MGKKSVYIEHSYWTNESNWPLIKEFFQVNTNCFLCVSDWNLIEISRASDFKQAKRRIAFIQSFNPKWILIKTRLQELELKNFIYKYYYRALPQKYDLFIDNFQEYMSILLKRPCPKVDLWKFVRGYMNNPDSLLSVTENINAYPEEFRRLKELGLEAVQAKDDEILKLWVKDILPKYDPIGNLTDKIKLTDFCVLNKATLMESCPYFQYEDALFAIRYKQGKKPKPSDAIDLEHICGSVPYCDYVVIKDGYARKIANEANKSLGYRPVLDCVRNIEL